MAGLKEIKRRLRSVRNTMKITYAMKLVSAARLRKAQDAVLNFHVYLGGLKRLLGQLSVETGGRSLVHPLMEGRQEVKTIALVIVGGRRGLCGGYNTNLHRKIESVIREQTEAHPEVKFEFYILGKKPADFFRRIKRQYNKAFEDLPEDPAKWPVTEVGSEVEQGFVSGRVDEVWLLYTRFKSAVSHPAVCERLLPLAMEEDYLSAQNEARLAPGMTLFEPDPGAVFAAVIPQIMKARIWQACLDAVTSETASRMTAMDSATRNAGMLCRRLELKHNKMRQLRITTDLIDIVGGAEALK